MSIRLYYCRLNLLEKLLSMVERSTNFGSLAAPFSKSYRAFNLITKNCKKSAVGLIRAFKVLA